MKQSIFGWSYPPGCSGPPGYEEFPCEVCGGVDDHDCICPECPECGDIGSWYCYLNHGLKRNEEQKFFREMLDREIIAEIESQNKAYGDILSEKP